MCYLSYIGRSSFVKLPPMLCSISAMRVCTFSIRERAAGDRRVPLRWKRPTVRRNFSSAKGMKFREVSVSGTSSLGSTVTPAPAFTNAKTDVTLWTVIRLLS